MKLYIGVGGREKKDSNEEPTTGTVAIQMVLCNGHILLTLAYRISVKRLIKQPPSHQTLWPHNGPINPQSHCCEFT